MASSCRTRENASSRSRLSSSADRKPRSAFLPASVTLLRGDRSLDWQPTSVPLNVPILIDSRIHQTVSGFGIPRILFAIWFRLELLMHINLRQGVHPQYLESGCNFEHDLGFRVFRNKHNLWPAWDDPKNIAKAMSSWLLTTSYGTRRQR
jgi:hypothetical protein